MAKPMMCGNMGCKRYGREVRVVGGCEGCGFGLIPYRTKERHQKELRKEFAQKETLKEMREKAALTGM